MNTYKISFLESWTFVVEAEGETEEEATQNALRKLDGQEFVQLTQHSRDLLGNGDLEFFAPTEYDFVDAEILEREDSR